MQTRNILYLFLCGIILMLFSCEKSKPIPALDPDEVYITEAVTADSMLYEVSNEKDSLVTMKFSAALKNPATTARKVVFQVDTTKIKDFRLKYGDAYVLPANSYNVAWLDCYIPAGESKSKAAEINLVKEKSLRSGSTYVLPIVLQSIDEKTEGLTGKQVLYLVVKTAESNLIDKADWRIKAYSSVTTFPGLPSFDYLFAAANAIDNNVATTWYPDVAYSLAQYITIDMGQSTRISVVTYNTLAANYPTSVKIELSADGTNWTDKGTYAGAQGAGLQNLRIGASTARYFRFTMLELFQPGAVQIPEIGALRN